LSCIDDGPVALRCCAAVRFDRRPAVWESLGPRSILEGADVLVSRLKVQREPHNVDEALPAFGAA